MSKFNVAGARPAALSPVRTETVPSGRNHEGAPGYARDAKSELFLLAVSNMVGEDTFYEPGKVRDTRYAQLIAHVAIEDPLWTADFLRWLRLDANMRSASLVGAAEVARARLAAGVPGGRQVVDSVLRRADEPGEMLAYWTARYGRAIPKPVKRGVADAVARLYTERALLKYDTASRGFRFGDVIDLVHPAPDPAKPWQGALFEHALDRRHDRDKPIPDALRIVTANARLRSAAREDTSVLLDAEALRTAGMTWEEALSLGGSTVDKAALWEAMIPSMGLMALARNVRNFDEARVCDSAIASVLARFADPEQIAASRMFPFRWLSAYEAAPSPRWGSALEKALNASLANMPTLGGRSLILVDTSASMTRGAFATKSTMTPAKAAAVFGVALAAKGECVDLWGFADGVFRHEIGRDASVLREVAAFTARIGEVGHGTRIAASLRATLARHDRVFLISDMQTMDTGVCEAVPAHIPIYGFNLGGYRDAAYSTGSAHRHEFGGLTDATFSMIPLLEAGRNARWPWQ